MFRILFLTALLLWAGAAQAQWREFETAHFIIYSKSSDEEATKLAEKLEGVDGLMRMATRLGDAVDPVKVRIYAVSSTADIERALGVSGTGIAGFYDSNILGPYAVTPRKTYFQQALFTPELVLHHEYAHHFMLQYFPAIYPPWYVEGFAELIGSSKFLPDGKIAYGMPAKHRGDAILQDWMSLDDILLAPPEKLHNFDLYGQGWAVTHFLTFSKKRAPQLRQYLAALIARKTNAEAALVFGDLRELNREARSYLDAGTFEYRPVAVTIARPVVQKIRALSPGEAALIPETIAFRDDELSAYRKEGARAREKTLREENLARIREKVQQFQGDAFALHLLAEAEYAVENYPQAEAAVDRLLALQPGHVRGMARKSMILARSAQALTGSERSARSADARALALRANKADPADPLPLLAFYQSFHLTGTKPTGNAIDGLMQAVQILPRDTSIRQLLVDQFAAEKRWGEAIAALTLIANAPHASPRRDAAREQMALLQVELAKQGTASTAPASGQQGAAAQTEGK